MFMKFGLMEQKPKAEVQGARGRELHPLLAEPSDFAFGSSVSDTAMLGSPTPMSVSQGVDPGTLSLESNGCEEEPPSSIPVPSLSPPTGWDQEGSDAAQKASSELRAGRPAGSSSIGGAEVTLAEGGCNFAAPKPAPFQRSKVPFEKGFSQMGWLKLMRTHPDLAGLKGCPPRRGITMKEVKQHRSPEDAWMVLKGKVYNITPYLDYHPGGRDMLMKGAGRDGTSLFNKYHAWVNSDFLMEKCFVGMLDTDT